MDIHSFRRFIPLYVVLFNQNKWNTSECSETIVFGHFISQHILFVSCQIRLKSTPGVKIECEAIFTPGVNRHKWALVNLYIFCIINFIKNSLFWYVQHYHIPAYSSDKTANKSLLINSWLRVSIFIWFDTVAVGRVEFHVTSERGGTWRSCDYMTSFNIGTCGEAWKQPTAHLRNGVWVMLTLVFSWRLAFVGFQWKSLC